MILRGFNTQPPEGGWLTDPRDIYEMVAFQHTAARRRLVAALVEAVSTGVFQHTAARRRLDETNRVFMFHLTFQHTAARRRLEPLSKALLHQVSQP